MGPFFSSPSRAFQNIPLACFEPKLFTKIWAWAYFESLGKLGWSSLVPGAYLLIAQARSTSNSVWLSFQISLRRKRHLQKIEPWPASSSWPSWWPTSSNWPPRPPTPTRSTSVSSKIFLEGGIIAKRKDSCYPSSSLGFLPSPFIVFSLLLSLWTVLRLDPSRAKQWIL